MNDNAWDVFLARCAKNKKKILAEAGQDFRAAATLISEQAAHIRDLEATLRSVRALLRHTEAEHIAAAQQVRDLKDQMRRHRTNAELLERIDHLIAENEQLEVERDEARMELRAFEIAVKSGRKAA